MIRYVLGFASGVVATFAWAVLKHINDRAAVVKGDNVLPFPNGKWNPPA